MLVLSELTKEAVTETVANTATFEMQFLQEYNELLETLKRFYG